MGGIKKGKALFWQRTSYNPMEGAEVPLDTRFWELDFLRRSAVVSMIVFHAAFDLNYFGPYKTDVHSGFWLYFGLMVATTFILAAGISLSLNHSRDLMKGFSREEIRDKLIIRGLWIFSLGLGVTMATYLLVGQDFIIFGVIHLIGISTILAWPFFSVGRWNVLAASAIIFLGIYLQGLIFGFSWLL
jgi:uncharacterized membrane protein